MPHIGDGAAGFTQMDPGAGAWLAQANANFQQANDEQSWASMVTAGEAIEAGRWVYMGGDGKVYKTEWDNDTQRVVVGVCPQAIDAETEGRVYHMGRVPMVSGFGVGVRLYLSSDGTVSESPGDASDAAKRLVVGMQWSATEFLVNCLHAMNVF